MQCQVIQPSTKIDGLKKKYNVQYGETIKAGSYVSFANGMENEGTSINLAKNVSELASIKMNDNLIICIYKEKSSMALYIQRVIINGSNLYYETPYLIGSSVNGFACEKLSSNRCVITCQMKILGSSNYDAKILIIDTDTFQILTNYTYLSNITNSEYSLMSMKLLNTVGGISKYVITYTNLSSWTYVVMSVNGLSISFATPYISAGSYVAQRSKWYIEVINDYNFVITNYDNSNGYSFLNFFNVSSSNLSITYKFTDNGTNTANNMYLALDESTLLCARYNGSSSKNVIRVVKFNLITQQVTSNTDYDMPVNTNGSFSISKISFLKRDRNNIMLFYQGVNGTEYMLISMNGDIPIMLYPFTYSPKYGNFRSVFSSGNNFIHLEVDDYAYNSMATLSTIAYDSANVNLILDVKPIVPAPIVNAVMPFSDIKQKPFLITSQANAETELMVKGNVLTYFYTADTTNYLNLSNFTIDSRTLNTNFINTNSILSYNNSWSRTLCYINPDISLFLYLYNPGSGTVPVVNVLDTSGMMARHINKVLPSVSGSYASLCVVKSSEDSALAGFYNSSNSVLTLIRYKGLVRSGNILNSTSATVLPSTSNHCFNCIDIDKTLVSYLSGVQAMCAIITFNSSTNTYTSISTGVVFDTGASAVYNSFKVNATDHIILYRALTNALMCALIRVNNNVITVISTSVLSTNHAQKVSVLSNSRGSVLMAYYTFENEVKISALNITSSSVSSFGTTTISKYGRLSGVRLYNDKFLVAYAQAQQHKLCVADIQSNNIIIDSIYNTPIGVAKGSGSSMQSIDVISI